jgi:membrane-associated HD superfamily phosphohydrolase
MEDRILFDADGEEIKVPDEKQINDWKAGHDKNIERKETEKELKDDLANFQNDGKSMNFRAIRQQNEKLKAELETRGKVITDKGNIEEKADNLTQEGIIKIAKEEMKNEITKEKVNSVFAKINDKDQREVARDYFNRLSTGKNLTNELIEETMSQALNLAKVDATSTTSISGKPPIFEQKKENSEAREEMKNRFGFGKEEEEDKKKQ